MKILFNSPIFNPTGISTAGREYVKALDKLGVQVQTNDPWHSTFDFNKGLEKFNNAIDVKDAVTLFWNYPFNWKDGHGKLFGGFVHEGTKLFPEWVDMINKADVVWVPSNAVKRMFLFNGVNKKIYIIPHGTDFELYKPNNQPKTDSFVFLSINSWTGEIGDRKGTDLLIKAFDEEFKDEDVRLMLKVSTFWQQPINVPSAIYNVLGHINEKIMFSTKYVPESELVTYYQNADVFVAPTRGEGFGLTILNALASGLPVIATKDNNSGHMDFCRANPGVLFVDAPTMAPADPRFYCPGNMQPVPSIESLRKQMRWAYENRNKLPELGLKGREFVKEFTWENSAKKIMDMINNER